MDRATYNITSDKLKAWFDERLSQEDYESMRRARFTFWHGSKCFAAKWSPQAEDVLACLGITEIEEDDSTDDVAARVERFQKYADRAESDADSSQTYLEERANTERRRENASNAIVRNLSVAKHWNQRIQGAIRNAAYKERVGVIARRIKGLESDLRRMQKREDSYAKRWVEHLENRIAYETASYQAGGGTEEMLHPPRKKAVQPKGVSPARDGSTPQKLGAAGWRRGYGNDGPLDWYLVIKVNRTTVELLSDSISRPGSFYVCKREIYGMATTKTPEQTAIDHPSWVAAYHRLMEQRAARKAAA